MSELEFDVIIVGGGPAGLSAALVLGRCRRRVVVCDAGQPRNAASHGLHLFLTRDGIEPAQFLSIAREQLRPYDTVELRSARVSSAKRLTGGFEIKLEAQDGKPEGRVTARKLLLATGVVDTLPNIEGLAEFYGTSVFHCPYCDGWEMRDQPLAVYGRGESGLGLALELSFWSRELVLCTDGPSELTQHQLERLSDRKIDLREDKIKRIEGRNGHLEKLVFETGEPLALRGMFFSTDHRQGSDLAGDLGCQFNSDGCVETGDYEITSVAGVYAAGDSSRLAQFVIVAASEGAQAALAINKELMKEDLD
ncbi:MAG TPA: NAD(P)/FAD-dependent oxidoreductase [Pyrinomonadaceae bacterium]|nr:NAD(P)/FAD-dependent oxidoreductase [Pyrinomonadaceae bacterium]